MNVLKKLWRRLTRSAPATPAQFNPLPPETAPKTHHGRGKWGRLMAILDDMSGPSGRVDYTRPKFLPGVLPKSRPVETEAGGIVMAMDQAGAPEVPCMAFDSSPAAWGGMAQAIGPGLAFLGFPYLAELNQITEYRTPAELLSDEMTRRWGKVVNAGEDDLADKLADITERMEQLKVRDKFRECALKTEEFGRSHLSIIIKGQDSDATRQLPLDKIEQGTLVGFTSIEPYWLTPYSWNSTDPMRPDFYKPQSWYVLGRKTHASRMMTFIFREVPDLLKPAYDFAGISMTQLMMPYVNRWLRTAKNVNDLINIFSIVTLATDLNALLEDPVEFEKRMAAFTRARDNRGMMLVNKDTEELSVNEASLASLDKLQAQSQEHMATPARTPLIKFFGITPSGLNATAEPELRVHEAYVKGMQEKGYNTHIDRVLALVQMDMYGEVDPNIKWEWTPLFEPSGKELAEIRKSDADRDAAYVNMGAIDNEEVRGKLKSDPESGYNNLVGDAPDPPALVEIGAAAEAQGGNEGKPGEKPGDKPPSK
jgi:phage-related protein (TIGR01555 family)